MRYAAVLIALLTSACVFGRLSSNPNVRNDVVVGIATESITPVPVEIAVQDGTFVRIGTVVKGRALCFHWHYVGYEGHLRSYDERGEAITVDFQPYTADAWTWHVDRAEMPRSHYGIAACAWEVRSQ